MAAAWTISYRLIAAVMALHYLVRGDLAEHLQPHLQNCGRFDNGDMNANRAGVGLGLAIEGGLIGLTKFTLYFVFADLCGRSPSPASEGSHPRSGSAAGIGRDRGRRLLPLRPGEPPHRRPDLRRRDRRRHVEVAELYLQFLRQHPVDRRHEAKPREPDNISDHQVGKRQHS